MKIIDENGNRCGVGTSGQICVKQRYKFLGYYNNSMKTNESFDREGFFLTGDIGYFDDGGYLYVISRRTDILFYQNNEVHAFRIETYLEQLADIESVCVVGIPCNSSYLIDNLISAVVKRSKESKISVQKIYDIVAGKKFILEHVKTI